MKPMLKGFISHLALASGIFLYSGVLSAGTTGKITGIITDSDTKEPLIGANVIVEGSAIGAAADLNGRYIIINVPPGFYSLRVSMMGYKPIVVQNIRVSIDLTTTINATMEQAALESSETVTVVAERPLIKMDMTSAMSSVSSEEIANLPVQELGDVLQLQAGIVDDGGLHIRGGRSGEIAYWVDGVATTDVYSGDMGVTVEIAAVQELQVVSGTFNAEHGQAMSGIINILTKEGQKEYSGMIKTYLGDYISRDNIFSVLSSKRAVADPATSALTSVGENDYPLRKLNPIYNAEATLSGPLPLTRKQLTFFINGRFFQDEGYLYGRNWFTPQGFPGDSSLVPMNPSRKTSAQGKLTYRVSPNLKIGYSLFWNESHQNRYYSQSYKYNPYGVSQGLGSGLTHLLTLNHVLSPKTFYEIRINRLYTDYKRYVYKDANAKPHYLVKWIGDAGDVKVFDPDTPDGALQLENRKKEDLPFQYIIDPDGPAGYVHPDSARTGTSYSFQKAGMDMSHFNRSTSYWVGKIDLTSQVNTLHQIKSGFEVRLHELKLNSFTIQPKTKPDANEQLVPFEPYVHPISSIYHDQYTRKPMEFAAYVQDKLELRDLIINIGLRYDYFDANSVVPTDPADPNIYDPFQDINRFKNPQVPEAERILYSLEERRDRMQKKVDAKMQISPRVGIAYPITDQGVIHFSYGHFFQMPEFQYLYESPDFKITTGGGYTIFGNADLKPQRTSMYEIGFQQQLTQDIGIDMTLFYRDIRDWVGSSPLTATYRQVVKYSTYINKDYSNVRGVTLKLEKRYSNHFSGRIDYSYQVAEGTYSNARDAYDAAFANKEPRLALIPLNWDQRHTLNGSFSYQQSGWTLSMVGKFWSGRPYTPQVARGETVGGTSYVGFRENSERLPSVNSIDLYLNKQFSLGALKYSLFIDVYNLFDRRDETAVYGDTGTARYTTTVDPRYISYDPNRVSTIEDYVLQPSWYTAPREIHLGIGIEF